MEVPLSSNPSFKDFVFRKYRTTVRLGTVYLIIQFIIFKSLYPFASFIPDSYGYLEAAVTNAPIHVWPIGYSKFLRAFHALTSSDTALIFTQYVLLEAAALYFIFTLLYILQLGRIVANILLLFILVNPLLLWISNYISSDALFTTLSLIWISQLLWILYRPRPYYIWLQVLILFLAFTIRYNALYYPFIAAGAILSSRMSWPSKITSIGLSMLLIGTFLWYSSNKYQELTGDRELSAFSGWQIASNALYMYSRIKNHTDAPPPKFSALHQITLKHIDSLQRLKTRPDSILSIYYLWEKKAPLQKYMESKWGTGVNSAMNYREWASMSKLYSSYGFYLIKNHPLYYVKYYILPNTVNYCIPRAEILNYYNVEGSYVRPLAQIWFKYSTTKIEGFSNEIEVNKLYSVFYTLANSLFIYTVIIFLIMRKSSQRKDSPSSVHYLAMIIWIANFAFSILASPVVLRYQIFPLILFFSYGTALFELTTKPAPPTNY